MRIDKTTVDAAMEMLRFELDKVAANIIDVNTEAKKARVVTLKLTFTPNERIREDVVIGIAVDSKLAPVHPFKHDASIVKVSDRVFALRSNRSVSELLNQVGDERVDEMDSEKLEGKS